MTALGEAVGTGLSVIAALAATTQTSGRPYYTEKGIVELPGLRNEFYEVVNSDPSKPVVLPEVRIDGRYGAPSADVFKSDLAVLVGAGIGVGLDLSGRTAPSFAWFQVFSVKLRTHRSIVSPSVLYSVICLLPGPSKLSPHQYVLHYKRWY